MAANKAFKRNKALQSLAASCPFVDADAVQGFWDALDNGEKLRLMRFDDRVLVERVARVQQDLSNSDLMCYQLGLRGQDSARQVGMDQFALECEATTYRPVVFYAKPEFVERGDLFDYIKERLGRAFLQERPVRPRKDWPAVLEPCANSWRSFMDQVFELVELAILQAYREGTATGKKENSVVEDGIAERASAELLAMEKTNVEQNPKNTKSAKRRARKKNIDAVAVLDEIETASTLTEVGSTYFSQQDMETASSFTEVASTFTAAASTLTGAASVSDPFHSSLLATVAEGETNLNCDWNPDGQPIDTDAMENAEVEIEVDWSGRGTHPEETRWSAWLPNGGTGCSAEWHWVTGTPTKAFLKNTFVETAYRYLEDQRARPRSVPARRRPTEL